MMRRSTLALVAIAAACSSPTAPVAVGTWGGPEASLVLTRAGGNLSYSCGAGTIDSAWTISDDGQFLASGEHFFGGGPVPPQGREPHPARYSGTIKGNALTLTVTLSDLDLTLGPYRLLRGGPIAVELCL